MDQKQQDFYLSLRNNITTFLNSDKGKNYKWAEYLLLVPDFFHLLVKLSLDRRIGVKEKAILGIAIAYFISPVDLLPEIILGPVGLIDDLAIAAFALNKIIGKADVSIVLEHWAGKDDLLVKINEIIQKADDMLGSGLVRKIKKILS
jgi:uncharacterized membrane protein YkvA (DUF1232 family)